MSKPLNRTIYIEDTSIKYESIGTLMNEDAFRGDLIPSYPFFSLASSGQSLMLEIDQSEAPKEVYELTLELTSLDDFVTTYYFTLSLEFRQSSVENLAFWEEQMRREALAAMGLDDNEATETYREPITIAASRVNQNGIFALMFSEQLRTLRQLNLTLAELLYDDYFELIYHTEVDEGEGTPKLIGWNVTEFSSLRCYFKVQFTNNLYVSSG